ncbi:DUF4132 domain-containing protein [Pseudoalteromonas rhizosphaerae]|uniref:DUF4132 domain-containing protein n=1 Tax=Pseudoalteromonas rhizosphaerae TaxID=2518973 RepID=UPI00384B9EE5
MLNTLNTPPNTDIAELLTLACKGYEIAESGLAHNVTHYLLHGGNPRCLTTLAQLPDTKSKQAPGCYDWEAAEAMWQVLMSTQSQQLDFLHRLGLVVACFNEPYFDAFSHVLSSFDNWFAYLLNFLNRQFKTHTASSVEQLPNRHTLLELLKIYQLPSWYIDAFILERNNKYVPAEYAQYLLTHTNWLSVSNKPDFDQQLQQLHSEGRYIFCCQLTKYCELPNTLLPLVMTLADDSTNKVRQAAALAFTRLDTAIWVNYLKKHYQSANTTTQAHWITLISRYDAAQPLLTQWLSETKSNVLQQQITQAQHEYQLIQKSQYFDWPLPSLPPLSISHDFPERWLDVCQQVLSTEIAKAEQEIATAQEALLDYPQNCHQRQQRLASDRDDLQGLRSLTPEQLAQALAQLQQRQIQTQPGYDIIYRLVDNKYAAQIIGEAKLMNQSDAQLVHFFLLATGLFYGLSTVLEEPHPSKLIQRDIKDIRQLQPVLHPFGISPSDLTNYILDIRHEPSGSLPIALESFEIWPLFAHYPQTMALALDGQLSSATFSSSTDSWIIESLLNDRIDSTRITEQALALLADFPAIPPYWLERIYQLAFDNRKHVRKLAQYAVQQHELLIEKITTGLASSNKETRSLTAQWLTHLQHPDAKPALQDAITTEKDTTTRNQLLDALQQCGGDISYFITPAILAEEAATGLKKAAPKHMAWLQQAMLPTCHFRHGDPVEPSIIYWWCVLAVKLKQPQGSNLLRLYLSLLDDDSQARLGHFLLSAFISQDTLAPSDQQAHDYAQANKQREYNRYQDLAQYDWGQEYATRTLLDAYNACYNLYKSQLHGSAIKEKGLLALINGGNPQALLALIQPYMKKHYLRRTQIEAMISALAHINDTVIIQFMLSIARQHRTQSIQALARELVGKIAKRNSWTTDELADRTIQTAGLEHIQDPTPFSFGNRALQLQLSDSLKLQLINEEGKVIKSLPQPRKEDSEDQINQTKKWFSGCKKELKQVIEQQHARLYAAMITERHWPLNEWHEYLHQHPVMFRLLQRTLWQVQLDNDWHTFRPTEDGSLVDVNDEEVTLTSGASIRLLSANQLDKAALKAWQLHLKDYKIKPLFEQLKSADISVTPKQISLEHHLGLMSDAFTLRGLLTKLGYQRGETEDGAFFNYYEKSFEQVGLRIQFEFSGNYLPEENEPAAIYGCKILQQIQGSRTRNRYKTIPLAQAPANLLNAIALDYQHVAKKCHADPNWLSKLPW